MSAPGGHDPFAVDTGNALEALREAWGGKFDIWHDGKWHAKPLSGSRDVLTCETPDELVRAMRGAP